jgi:hypothetical protein
MMSAKNKVRLPTGIRRALAHELDSHLDAHLRSDHLPHIQAAKKRRAKLESKKVKNPEQRIVGLFRIYTCDMATVARQGLSDLHAGGWVVLAQTRPDLLAKIEVQPHNREFRVVRVATGALAEDMNFALQKLIARSSRQKAQEFRLLSIPAMHILALWSHSPKHPERDVLSAVSLNFASFKQQRIYSRAAVDKLLRRHAADLILHWYERYQKERTAPAAS